MRRYEYQVVEDPLNHGVWAVVVKGSHRADRPMPETLFKGPSARRKAREYAAFLNSRVTKSRNS